MSQFLLFFLVNVTFLDMLYRRDWHRNWHLFHSHNE